jgi:hypothetical protein
MALYVRCDRCDCELEHVCNPDLRKAVKALFRWTPESGFPALQEGVPEEKIEGAPFLSEAFLYLLLGKDDARTLMALVNGVVCQAGLDPDVLRHEVHMELAAEQQEKAAQEAARARRKGKSSTGG